MPTTIKKPIIIINDIITIFLQMVNAVINFSGLIFLLATAWLFIFLSSNPWKNFARAQLNYHCIIASGNRFYFNDNSINTEEFIYSLLTTRNFCNVFTVVSSAAETLGCLGISCWMWLEVFVWLENRENKDSSKLKTLSYWNCLFSVWDECWQVLNWCHCYENNLIFVASIAQVCALYTRTRSVL